MPTKTVRLEVIVGLKFSTLSPLHLHENRFAVTMVSQGSASITEHRKHSNLMKPAPRKPSRYSKVEQRKRGSKSGHLFKTKLPEPKTLTKKHLSVATQSKWPEPSKPVGRNGSGRKGKNIRRQGIRPGFRFSNNFRLFPIMPFYNVTNTSSVNRPLNQGLTTAQSLAYWDTLMNVVIDCLSLMLLY